MHGLRNPGSVFFTTLLCTMLSAYSRAQVQSLAFDAPQGPQIAELLPNAPQSQTVSPPVTDQQASGTISSTVLDANGAQVAGALVSLQTSTSKATRTVTTDTAGNFNFSSVEAGTFRITIISAGFATWLSPLFILQNGQSHELPPITLRVASAMTNVNVNFTRYDIAEEQVNLEEKQRVLGVFPNFYVSYTWDAAPLTSGQKFRLALRTSYDPVSFAVPAIVAGVEQSQNTFSGYGQGTQGYFKRYGASYGDGFIGNMIGNAILPSLLHQDPRYFYKGTGTIRSRALYAISTAFICKGDDGRWQPNYSFILGNFAAAGISNAYYPASDRNGAGLTITNALIDTASGAATSLIQEFFVKKISRRVSRGSQP